MGSPKFDYYWRDYFGDIPDDAVPGGYDRNLQRTYIGQLFVLNHGLLPTRIIKGEKAVTASKDGSLFVSCQAIKILCSEKRREKLTWFQTTARTLHTDVIGKHLVVGGFENGKILNIGRSFNEDVSIVGKVCGYNIGQALLYFPQEQREYRRADYEILIYEEYVKGVYKSGVLEQSFN